MSRRKILSVESARNIWLDSRKVRFLAIGAWNTLFGYLSFYVLFLIVADRLHYLFVALIAHFVAVTQSYFTQRRLVFLSNAPIAREFLRFNTSHIGTLLFGLLAMSLLVETVGLSPLAAQAIIIVMSMILSYLLHSRFSFLTPAEPGDPRG